MRVHEDCLPCIKRQIYEAALMASGNEEQIRKILDGTEHIIDRYLEYSCTPEISKSVHSVVVDITGNKDPFKEIKERDIGAALQLYPLLKSYLETNGNDLSCALKISAAGNIIDAAINKDIDIREVLFEELARPFFHNDLSVFMNKLIHASMILIVGDNSGESVFDRVLAESLSADIIYSVRSAPILNDVTMKEALESGLAGCTRIVSSGCCAPGTILEMCSREFQDIFDSADIVISKGQGNYEALSECERDIFFLLKAKCPVIAGELGVSVGDHVFKYKMKS